MWVSGMRGDGCGLNSLGEQDMGVVITAGVSRW